MWLLAVASGWQAALSADARRCAEELRSRDDFPALLLCLGLEGEAVEVGVQAGVHAAEFLEAWPGVLHLVDLWGSQEEEPGFYVDIANVASPGARAAHRDACVQRLQAPLDQGRAQIVELESTAAAARFPDASLDFVYLDARHDLAGVVADIHAWWPKVKPGGVFAGHDYAEGEFPEGDFFWETGLARALGVEPMVTREANNKYESFFVVKTAELADLVPTPVAAADLAVRLYLDSSPYYALWQRAASDGNEAEFGPACTQRCGADCDKRLERFVPGTLTAQSTLRPFACDAERADACGAAVAQDERSYHRVCTDRCAVTCAQRAVFFPRLAGLTLAV